MTDRKNIMDIMVVLWSNYIVRIYDQEYGCDVVLLCGLLRAAVGCRHSLFLAVVLKAHPCSPPPPRPPRRPPRCYSVWQTCPPCSSPSPRRLMLPPPPCKAHRQRILVTWRHPVIVIGGRVLDDMVHQTRQGRR